MKGDASPWSPCGSYATVSSLHPSTFKFYSFVYTYRLNSLVDRVYQWAINIHTSHFLQVGILENVYEFWLPQHMYEREGIGLNEPYHQITELLQQEYYVST